MKVILPEKMTLAQDADERVKHFRAFESLEFLCPVGTSHRLGREPAEVNERSLRICRARKPAAEVLDEYQGKSQLSEPGLGIDLVTPPILHPEDVIDPV
jgi:hypothetical protein